MIALGRTRPAHFACTVSPGVNHIALDQGTGRLRGVSLTKSTHPGPTGTVREAACSPMSVGRVLSLIAPRKDALDDRKARSNSPRILPRSPRRPHQESQAGNILRESLKTSFDQHYGLRIIRRKHWPDIQFREDGTWTQPEDSRVFVRRLLGQA